MLALSPKQRELRERDRHVLEVARNLLLEHGYFGVTMDQIARESGCPKGTLYNRFACKEDMLVAMAVESLERRSDMFRRAIAFDGRTRERALAIGEAAALFGRINPQDLLVLHAATGAIREKASLFRITALREAERVAMSIYVDLLNEAVAEGDLRPDHDGAIEEMAVGGWGMLEGGFSIIQDGIPQHILGLEDSFYKLWRYYNCTLDAYGWAPLFRDWDYEESLANVRKTVFPEEAVALYGAGNWYGDHK